MAAKTNKTNRAKGKTTKPTRTRRTRSPRTKRPDIWQDDLGIGYATYEHEEDYVSPATIQDENQITSFQDFRNRLAKAPIFAETDIESVP